MLCVNVVDTYTIVLTLNLAAPENGIIFPSRRQSPQARLRVLQSRSRKKQLIKGPAGENGNTTNSQYTQSVSPSISLGWLNTVPLHTSIFPNLS